MFTKTQKRIYNTLMGISAILVVLIITAAATILPGLFFNAYKSQATNKLDRSFYAARVYVDSVMSTVDNLAANTQVIDAVTSGSANGITTLLDDARTYGNYINAVTLYGASGKVYANSDVVNPPTLSRLKQDAHIADFIADDNATDYVSVRTDAVAEAFGNTPYDSERGIVSYCRKIYDNNAVVGYIFADLFPETIFDYFDFGADSHLGGSITILSYDGGYIANDNIELAEQYINAPNNKVTNKHLVLTAMRNFYGGTIRIVVPMTPYYRVTIVVLCLIVAVGIMLIILTHFIAKRNAQNVSDRLDNLLVKLTESTERFTQT